MGNLPIELLRKVVKYDVSSGKLVWAERDASCYPNAQSTVFAEGRAKHFNKVYAGQEVIVKRNNTNARYVYLRFLGQVASISADRLLWVAISGELTEHPLYYKNGDASDTSLENIILTHTLAKQVLLNPDIGIKPYSVDGKTKYQVVIHNSYVPRIKKAVFDTKAKAIEWRCNYLKQHDAYWSISATKAYKANKFKHENETLRDS